MPATSKEELITLSEKEFAKLMKQICGLDEHLALQKDNEDTSIKDVVAHRAHWIHLFLGWYRDGLAGKTVHFPARGYKWNQLKLYNSRLRKEQASLNWDDAKSDLSSSFDALMAFLKSNSDTALYGEPMKGAHNDWTPGRWAEAAGPSHFRSAAKYIRQRLRSPKTC